MTVVATTSSDGRGGGRAVLGHSGDDASGSVEELAGAGAGQCMAAPEVEQVRGALGVLARCVAGSGGVSASRAQWAGLVASCQAIVNTAGAVQDVAIARLAAIEEEWCEDGTTAEARRVLGHVALDAPDVVAAALGVSHGHAQRRVALAVRLVAGGGGDDGRGGVDATGAEDAGDAGDAGGAGVSGLHVAMLAGELDGYRAGVVAEELVEAPVEVAQAVVAVLVPYLGVETAVQLRQRCRRALARISPDLLRQRAKRARESCGLRRWVQEPGVDRWEGTFPSEQAAQGWAAVDALARRYVAEGRCERVEAARSQALMDLVRGQATIEVELVMTVPAEVVSDAAAGSVPPVASRRGPAGATTEGSSDTDSPGESSPAEGGGPGRPPGALPSDRAVGDGHGSSFLSTEAVAPADPGCAAARVSTWPLTVGDEAAGVRTDDDDLVEVSGPFPGDPVLVHRAWIRSFLREHGSAGSRAKVGGRRVRRDGRSSAGPSAPGPHSPVQTRLEECHPATGALLGSGGGFGPGGRSGSSYRPGRRLGALVRARDGRCRFPGCSVAARFCDLDHVRPWPTGPTGPANLICLCRRHHRIKQRPGWTVRLRPDARAVWADPTGRVRTTWPRDLLHAAVLPADRTRSTTRATLPGPSARGATAPARSNAGVTVPVPASSPGPNHGDLGASALEVLLGVLTDDEAAGARQVRAPFETVTRARPATSGHTATGACPGADRPWPTVVRWQVPGPDPRCRRWRYVDERRGHVHPSRTGVGGSRPPDAVGTGPPPF